MEEIKKYKVISSPIRWTGSKKQIIINLFDYVPKNKTVFVEPFLGSGTVLLNILKNKESYSFNKYYVNDLNSNIITFFKELKNNCDILSKNISEQIDDYNSLSMEEKEHYYYELRNRFNSGNLGSVEKASAFYVLTRTCFNGVYRENSKGYYNVPFGKKEKIFFSKDNINEISKIISKVKIYNMDYLDFFNKVGKKEKMCDCFFYCDPPYIPDDDSVYQTQTLYLKNRFNHSQFIDDLEKINDACIIISMSESKKADEIYGVKFKKQIVKNVTRIVNPSRNKTSLEIIYSNYDNN